VTWKCMCEPMWRSSAVVLDDERAEPPLTQEVIDFCWEGYKVGQISADHTAKQVFEEVLQNLAVWLLARVVSPQATAQPATLPNCPEGGKCTGNCDHCRT
jgi:hypothetical protein